jgi:voltage-gated potassium channel Kch
MVVMGCQAASELLDHNESIIVIEKDIELVEKLRDSDILYIHGDATMEETLIAVNLKQAKALITTLPVDADNLFVVLSAREINPEMTIISRASFDHFTFIRNFFKNRKLKFRFLCFQGLVLFYSEKMLPKLSK